MQNESPTSLGSAVCTHIPTDSFHHVGQVTSCKLCGLALCYANHKPGSRVRMSKKERRKTKVLQPMVEETNVRR